MTTRAQRDGVNLDTPVSELTLGGVLLYALAWLFKAVILAGVFVSMWVGQMALLIILARLLGLHYTATGIPGLDRLAGEFLLTIPTLFTSYGAMLGVFYGLTYYESQPNS